MRVSIVASVGFVLLAVGAMCAGPVSADEGVMRNRLLPLGPGNARNSEGDFVRLKDGHVLLVYTHNFDSGGDVAPAHLAGRFSSDEGKTWEKIKTLEDNPHGHYCYTAVEFVGDCVLLAHCAGDLRKMNELALTQITRFFLDWLYK